MNMKLLSAFLLFCMLSYGQDCGNLFSQTNALQTQLENAEDSQTDGRISLRLAGNGSYMTILLGFIPGGTVNFDEGFEGNFINDGAVIEFYSFLGAIPLSIQALPELTNGNFQVRLGYELTADETYAISIDAEFLNPEFQIILEDRYEGVVTDLRQAAYSFSGVVGEVNDRFFLNLNYRSSLSVEDKEVGTNLKVYFHNETLTIQTTQTDLKTVELFNIAGKRILSADFINKIKVNSLTKGIYILRFTNASGETITKKIIK